MLSLLAVFAALMSRLRTAMSRMRMPTDEREGAAA